MVGKDAPDVPGGGQLIATHFWKVSSQTDPLQVEPVALPAATLAEATPFLPEGAYTTLRTYRQTALLLLDEHFDRLEASAQLLGHPTRLNRVGLRALLCSLLRGLHWKTSPETRLRLTVVIGEGAPRMRSHPDGPASGSPQAPSH